MNCSVNFSLAFWDLGKSLVMEFDQSSKFKCYFSVWSWLGVAWASSTEGENPIHLLLKYTEKQESISRREGKWRVERGVWRHWRMGCRGLCFGKSKKGLRVWRTDLGTFLLQAFSKIKVVSRDSRRGVFSQLRSSHVLDHRSLGF